MKNIKKEVKQSETIFRLGELFSGPGGLALGAIQSQVKTNEKTFRIKHVWSNDYDSDSCKTYARNICGGDSKTVLCGDVGKLDMDSLPEIDAFAYGFPCNDFSIVGKQKGFNGLFGPLYSYGIKVLERFNPKFFVAENVGGIATANDGGAFKKILSDISNAGEGYSLTVHLYKAENYGVPQTRHRIIIVGIKKSLNLFFKVPQPTTANTLITAGEALKNIPQSAQNNDFTRQSAIVEERLRYIKPGENVWNANLPPRLKLNVKGAKLSHIYKRLDPNKPSYTITGSGGGGTHVYHWQENRALTNRERARLQTFPDNFIFEGSKESCRKQIGMAVPPMLSETIFTAVLKTFAGVDYPSVPASWQNDGLFDTWSKR
ncbi:MAG: DNA cytosine methyltransferase [Elusimicrobia bacterium]|nr:DNA cytosine methyltransferase [Elusimicrobiota bacterium]